MHPLAPHRPPGSADVDAILATAAEVVAHPAVVAARQRASDALLAASPHVGDRLGAERNRRELPQAMLELVRSMACQAAADDPTNPRFNWSPHLGWRFGLDNPDTIYRAVRVSDDGRYEISGQRHSSVFAAFQLFDAYYGEGTESGRDPVQLGFLDGRDLVVDDDGSFTITLDGEPRRERINHLQLPPGSTTILVRDTLSDWAQQPMELTIRRLDRQPGPPRPLDELAADTARWVEIGAPYWDRITQGFTGLPANTLTPPASTHNGLHGQYSSLGHFVLADDQALVVRMPTFAAPYFGIQLGNDWFISTDYVATIGSLNNAQAEVVDGWVEVVIDSVDPGVHNWLDTTGLPSGLLFLRWQGLDAPPSSARPSIEVLDRRGGTTPVGGGPGHLGGARHPLRRPR